MMLSGLIPSNTYKFAHASAADPAPETTILYVQLLSQQVQAHLKVLLMK
jgi:hypothetical protein